MNTLNEIAILDFGSQYTHLIARRIRELGVKSHIFGPDVSMESLQNAKGIILSGGPRSTINDAPIEYNSKIFDLNIPILGLCYGHQLMANFFGGKVASGTSREYGLATLNILGSTIFKDINTSSQVWMSHGDHVEILPKGFRQIATTGNNSVAAMENVEKKLYGFQFHPEVHHTKDGQQMLQNFVFDICEAKKNWTADSMLEELQEDIRKQAGDKNVFLLVSGGVDSTVCFALLEKTLGKDRVYGLHVDHGMMRLDESEKVKAGLAKIGLDDLHIYNAEEEYLKALENIYDPEEKRKIIGELFIDIAERVMREMNFNEDDWLLGQGTIYPDTIESGGTKHSDKIKTHHNRVDRIQEMIAKNLIIEPIKELYKDEVREVGQALGLPAELIERHPFPGPGLAIRCLCSAEEVAGTEVIPPPNRGRCLPKGDGGGLRQLPIKSVGVQGDERTYAHPALLDEKLSIAEIETLAPEITNKMPGINRVLLHSFGDKTKLESSKVSQAYITKKRLDLLRDIDDMVNNFVAEDPNFATIWQMPIILVPFGHTHFETVILRPVESNEAMTVSFGKLTNETINKIISHPLITENIDYVFYDVTNKPPGTIEWE